MRVILLKIIPLEERIMFDAAGAAVVADALAADPAVAVQGADSGDGGADSSGAFAHSDLSSVIAIQPVAFEGSASDLSHDAFSSDFVAVEHASVATEHASDVPVSVSSNAPVKVLVVSSELADSDRLASAAAKDVVVVRYDPNTTTIGDLTVRVTTALEGHQAESISFATHGSGGIFHLTEDVSVTKSSLDASAALQGFWHDMGTLVKDGGSVNILAGKVADGGQDMLAEIDSLLDVGGKAISVSASVDDTGSHELGGNWVMEHSVNTDVSGLFDPSKLQAWDHLTTLPVDHTPVDVLVVSSRVSDSATLSGAALDNVLVVNYDASTTSLARLAGQITTALNGQQADSLTFATHGSSGFFHLTENIFVTEETLVNSSSLQNFWLDMGSLMRDGGRVDLLGCDIASGADGAALLYSLDALLDSASKNIFVSASIDGTGNGSSENWILEYGNVDASLYFDSAKLADWSGSLASYTVTTTADTINAGPGLFSLRDAIIAANGGAGSAGISYIYLSSGTYTLTRTGAGENAALTGDLDILANIVIEGGPGVTTKPIINAAGLGDRVFDVISPGPGTSSASLTLNGIVVTGGNVSGSGGGISVVATATGSAVGGYLTLNDCEIYGNTASSNGGGIYGARAQVSMTRTTINNNTATTGDGGGAYFLNGVVSIDSSAIYANQATAGSGGGIYAQKGGSLSLNITITGSTISGNSIVGGGNGAEVYNNNQTLGNIATMLIQNSTIHGSSAGVNSIYNNAGIFTMNNSILDNGSFSSTGATAVVSGGYNVFSDNSASGLFTNSLYNQGLIIINPTLAYNGGPTLNHALAPDSPALNKGDPGIVSPPSYDQRGVGYNRIMLGRIDVGAYETQYYNVTTNTDVINATDGQLSLREAVRYANTYGPATIVIGDPVYATTLPLLTYTLSRAGANEQAAANGDLDITTSIIIQGAVNPLGIPTINANALDRVFEIVNASSGLVLDNVKVTGGSLTTGNGGGILNNGGRLTLQNGSIVTGNSAGAGSGGGIYSTSALTNGLSIANSSVTNNTAGIGGGIYLIGTGTVSITNSVISSNTATTGSSGGIYDGLSGGLTIDSSTISGNTAQGTAAGAYAGGIYVMDAGINLILNSTISGNSANGTLGGGGVYHNQTVASGGSLTIKNSTISGNTALGTGAKGGGIFQNQGTMYVDFSTIYGNSAAASGGNISASALSTSNISLYNTIVANPVAGGNINNVAQVTSVGYNLFSDSPSAAIAVSPGVLINTNPLLGTLQNNGGPTQTLAIDTSSPAYNVGDPNVTGAPTFDQRGAGYTRIRGFNIDIGAYEVQVLDAYNDTYAALEDVTLVRAAPGVLGNDDTSQGPISVYSVNGETSNVGQQITLLSGASLQMYADGRFVYGSATDWNGSDSFTYVMTNGTKVSNSATVAVTVSSDGITANPDTFIANEDTLLSGGNVVTNDTATSPPITLISDYAPGASHGTVTWIGTAGAFTYLPDANYNGSDTFYYLIADALGRFEIGAVTITVTPVNDPPTFMAPNQTVNEDAGPQTVVGWANPMTTGPANESGQSLVWFTIVSNNNTALFAGAGGAPSFDINGTLRYTPATNANGVATIGIKLTDNGGIANGGVDTSAVQYFTITVNAVNDPPSFTKGSDQTVLEDAGLQAVPNWATNISPGPTNESTQTVNFVVTNNNNSLFSTQPSINSVGQLSYTPAPDANGSAIVSITPFDNGGIMNGGVNMGSVQTFTITVTPVNDPPTFMKGSDRTVLEDSGTHAVPGWATAISPGGGVDESAQTVSFVVTNNNNALFSTQPFIYDSNGSLTYTSAPNANGVAQVEIYAQDNGGGSNESARQTFTITVTPVNDPPPAIDDAVFVNQNSTIGGNVLINDSAANALIDSGETLSALLIAGPTQGIFNFAPQNGGFTYTPNANYYGTDSFTYKSFDGSLYSTGAATVTITVNARPVITPTIPAQVTNEGGSFTINLDSYVSDPDNTDAQLMWAYAGNASLGVTIDSLTHVATITPPDVNWNGAELIMFIVTDPGGFSASQNVNFIVNAVNDPPSFVLSGTGDTVLEDSGPRTVLGWATNISPGPANESSQIVSFIVTNNNNSLFSTQPTISSNGTLSYVPAPNANGSATVVNVTALDNGGTANGGVDTSAAQDFTITVTAVNDPPVGINDNFTTNEDVSVIGNVLTNDKLANVDGTNEPLTAQLVTNPSFGILTGFNTATGDFTYTPYADYYGPDSFTYRPYDVVSGNLTTVAITVLPVNDPPSFSKGSDQTVLEDSGPRTVLGWATAISAGPDNESTQTVSLYIYDITNPTLFNIQPSIDSNGTLLYAPATNAYGSAQVWVYARDSGGTTNGGYDTSAFKSFTITVNEVNDAPTFTKGSDQTVNEDAGPQQVPDWATNISPGPADESSQTVSFVVSNNNNALFKVQPSINSGGNLSYNPAPDANGVAVVQVYAQDSGGTENGGVDTSNIKIFTITVNAINDRPPAINDTVFVNQNNTITGNVLINDVAANPDGQSEQLTAVLVTSPSRGALIFASQNGGFTYTPNLNYAGSDSFTYRSFDGLLYSASDATVTITVNAPPNITATIPGQTILEGGSFATIDLDAVISDETPDQVTWTTSFSVVLEVTIDSSTLEATITPKDVDWNGTERIWFVVIDPGGLSDSQSVDFTVVPVNDAPTFTPGSNVVVLQDDDPITINGWATNLSVGPGEVSNSILSVSATANTDAVRIAAANASVGAYNYGVSSAPDIILAAVDAAVAIASVDIAVSTAAQGAAAGSASPAEVYQAAQNAANSAFASELAIYNQYHNPVYGAIEMAYNNGAYAVEKAKEAYDNGSSSQDIANATFFAALASSAMAGQWSLFGDIRHFYSNYTPREVVAVIGTMAAVTIAEMPPLQSLMGFDTVIVSSTNPSLFSTPPRVDLNGNLTFTPNGDAYGTATISVTLRDNGGIANGGVDTSDPQQFTITILQTIKVTITEDIINTSDGVTGLREAIILANNNGGGRIILDNETYELTLSGSNEDYAATGDLDIRSLIIIEAAPGADPTINASALGDRVFDVISGANLSLHGVTVTGGSLGAGDGGVIRNSGSLTVENSTISGNTLTNGDGGGIFNSSGTVTVTNSIITGNTLTNGEGGGIFNSSGTVTMTNSTISGNTAANNGGGISNNTGTFTIMNSTVAGNTAANNGGGIFNNTGIFMIMNSTISGNTATNNGGGIFSNTGAVTVKTSTIAGNIATSFYGGGIYNNGSNNFTIENSTIAKNTATSGSGIFNPSPTLRTVISNTILAKPLGYGTNVSGLVTSLGYNIVSDSSGSGWGSEDFTNSASLNAYLGTLENNGGPTKTIALLPGSPAINRGGGSSSDTDQRGYPRISRGVMDIGAFEYQTVTGFNDSVTINEDSSVTGNVLINDIADNVYGPSGPVKANLLTAPAHGSLNFNPLNGGFSYTPDANYFGTDSFTYRPSIGADFGNVTTVSIIIDPINDPPVGINDNFTTNEDATLTGNVLTNDSAANNDGPNESLTALLVMGPSHGTLTPTNFNDITREFTGEFTYIPQENYYGPDTFMYMPKDSQSVGSPVRVIITVLPVNDAPTFNQSSNGIVVTLAGGTTTIADWATDISDGENENPLVSVNATGATSAVDLAVVDAVVSAYHQGASSPTDFSTIASIAASQIASVENAISSVVNLEVIQSGDSEKLYLLAVESATEAFDILIKTYQDSFDVSNSPLDAGVLAAIQNAKNNGSYVVAAAKEAYEAGSSPTVIAVDCLRAASAATGEYLRWDLFDIYVRALGSSLDITASEMVALISDIAGVDVFFPTPPQTLTGFIVQIDSDPSGVISGEPSVNLASGVLSFVTNADVYGTATLSITLQDDGGTANGGLDTSIIHYFTITSADSLVVTTTQDIVALADADTSLREAIIYANNNGGGNIILNTVDTGIYVLNLSGSDEDLAATGDFRYPQPYYYFCGFGCQYQY